MMDNTIFNFALSCGYKPTKSDLGDEATIKRAMDSFGMTRDEAELYMDEMLREDVEEFFVSKFGNRQQNDAAF